MDGVCSPKHIAAGCPHYTAPVFTLQRRHRSEQDVRLPFTRVLSSKEFVRETRNQEKAVRPFFKWAHLPSGRRVANTEEKNFLIFLSWDSNPHPQTPCYSSELYMGVTIWAILPTHANFIKKFVIFQIKCTLLKFSQQLQNTKRNQKILA